MTSPPLTILVVGLGSAGDVHPNVGLALALKRRGHRVLFIGPAIFKPLAQRVGLEFFAVGSEETYYETIRDPDLWHPFRSFRVVATKLLLPAIRPIYELIAANHVPGRTLVTAPSTAFAARIAQEKLGLPLATVHLQPSLMRSMVDPACVGFPDILGRLPRSLRGPFFRVVDGVLIDPLIAAETNAFRAELGLPPVRRFFDRWMHSPQLVIGLFAEWFAAVPPDWPPHVRLAGFPLWDEREVREGSPELEAFLAAGAPPLVFTAGSAMAQGKEFFRVSAEVCRLSGKRGLLLTQFPEQLPAQLPEHVRHFHYIPFSAVLPRAAAFVHHGGIGTTAQAFAAGVPQLVVPLAHDQPDNAMRVKRLGVGDFLRPQHYKVKTVRSRIEALLGSSAIRDKCAQYANSLRPRDALDRTCEFIEGMPT